MIVLRLVAALAGVVLVLWTLGSAVQTVIVPRAVLTVLTRLHFRSIRRVFDLLARPSREFGTRDRIMALYAPISLVLLPAVWVSLVTVGFTAIFWGTGIEPVSEAFATSGSSLFTLGFDRPHGLGRVMLGFAEAGLGLGIVSLMISYLPTIYSSFRSREALVGMLDVRAGSPPSCTELLVRYQRIGWLDKVGEDLFEKWEEWFVDVEESHTSQGSLIFFRSPRPERNWLTAAGCVLDTAAIVSSTIDRPRNARPDLLLRTGFLCLRRIADFYNISYDPDPQSGDPILVSRREFDLVCVELRAADIPLKADLDQAWIDFAGWRVNYDTVLVELCALIMAPPAKWSSDRMPQRRHIPPLRRSVKR
jgi:hypothetical protein